MNEETPQAGNIKKVPDKPRSKKHPARRGYSLEEKLQVVRETLAPGASVSIVARRHDINSNVVFRWRRMYACGELGKTAGQKFLPVGVIDGGLPDPVHEGSLQGLLEAPPATHGVIEIETAAGVKVRVSGRVDDRTLNLVLAEIRTPPPGRRHPS